MKTPAERPFTLTEARQAGLDYWHLRAKRYRRLGPATYVSAKQPDSDLLRLPAAACRLPARSAFSNWVPTRQGGRGLINLRQVALHAEPKAESVMETRLRMLLVLAGLPRPEAQVPVHDRYGRFVGRPDLFYPELRLGLEYDG